MMRRTKIAVALFAGLPGAALACSVEEDDRPVEVQHDEWARESYSRANAMVEVVAVTGSRPNRPGVVRVLRNLKGSIKSGSHLILHSVDDGACGAGDFKRGSRGLILLDRESGKLQFQGFLRDDYLSRLDRLGLRPLDKQPVRRSKARYRDE